MLLPVFPFPLYFLHFCLGDSQAQLLNIGCYINHTTIQSQTARLKGKIVNMDVQNSAALLDFFAFLQTIVFELVTANLKKDV